MNDNKNSLDITICAGYTSYSEISLKDVVEFLEENGKTLDDVKDMWIKWNRLHIDTEDVTYEIEMDYDDDVYLKRPESVKIATFKEFRNCEERSMLDTLKLVINELGE